MSGANIERGTKVNLRGLDTGNATRSLMMIDGMRFPGQGNGQCVVDPSIIPALSMDHIDVLVDGASATYGSDAVGGVINIILKRNMDGAITQVRWTTAEGGKNRYLASAVWGRTWDGGQITLSYEWYNETPMPGNFHSKFGVDHSPWGFDDRTPLGSSLPAGLSTGAARRPGGPNPAGPDGDQVGTSAQPAMAAPTVMPCRSAPAGTSATQPPGPTLNWATFGTPANGGPLGAPTASGTSSIRISIAWYDARQERNGGHITVDQRLTSNISFYGSGFYSNRRGHYLNPSNLSPSATNILGGVTIPTFNPYYPTGAPTGGNTLRAHYNIGWESPSITSFYELAQRYQLGLNIALPGDWSGRVWYAQTKDANYNIVKGTTNKTAVSAALGWTISVDPAGRFHACDRDLDEAQQRSLPEPRLRPAGLYVQLARHARLHPGHQKLQRALLDQRKGRAVRRPAVRSSGRHGQGRYRRDLHQHEAADHGSGQHRRLEPDRALPAGCAGPPDLGRVHPGQHPAVQRTECLAVPAPRGSGILLASRPVQRREGHQQSEGGVQLGADRLLHHPRHLGHLVPRAGVRRIVAARQRRHRRPEPRRPSLQQPGTISAGCSNTAVCRRRARAPGS